MTSNEAYTNTSLEIPEYIFLFIYETVAHEPDIYQSC
jgi:hypothetical protein